MIKGLSKFIKLVHFIGDVLLLNFSFLLAYYFKFPGNIFLNFDLHYFFLIIVFNCIWIILVLLLKLYEIHRVNKIEAILLHLTKSIFLHALLILSFIVTTKAFYFSRKQLLFSYLIFGFLVLIWRFTVVYFLKLFRSVGGNFKQVIIVGSGASGNQLYNYLKKDVSSGYKFLGFFDDNPLNTLHPELILGSTADVNIFSLQNKVDEIFCALPLTATKKIRELVTFADNNLIRLRIVPDFRGFLNKKVNMDFFDDIPILSLRSEPLENVFNRFFKRTFDIVFSLSVIITLFPIIFPIFSLIIKLTSKGPVFFVQKRSGRNNEEFYCFKFRTMKINNQSETSQSVKGDERITKFGNFLRKSSLDELPQFINVLLGNMSVVGPRPHMLKHTMEYSLLIDKFMVRHLVKPGITGWAQAHGYRGPTTNPKYMIKRVRYDMWYIENWSLLLDFKIVILTVFNLIKGEENAG